jgi:hypothetical protein
VSLASGSTIPVAKANLAFLLSLSREFGNSNLYISLMEHLDRDLMCSQLHDSTTIDLFSEDLIGRMSSEFYGLTGSQLEAIPSSVLFHIMSHKLLIISSEDDLFSYISSRLCSDPEYLDLLQFVRFEYLSLQAASSFLQVLPDPIDHRLWESISRRLISRLCLPGVEFPLQEDKSVDGIISYLTRKHGGNVHDNGIVTITSKSLHSGDPRYALRNVADLTTDWRFDSDDEPGQWVCWDFHEMRIHPTYYTIRAKYLKSWVIESSLDGVAWTEIDRNTENDDFRSTLSEPPKVASFTVWNTAECRFIRLTQTGENHNGKDYLIINDFEFFGALVE